MHSAVIALLLVVAGQPCDDCERYPSKTQRSQFVGGFKARAEYRFWANHPAYYRPLPEYDYRGEFGYPWSAPHRGRNPYYLLPSGPTAVEVEWTEPENIPPPAADQPAGPTTVRIESRAVRSIEPWTR